MLLLVCCLYKEIYLQIFKCVSFWLHGCFGEWKGWARQPLIHTSWVAVVTPTDRSTSVRNRCVIELFWGVVCVITLSFWHFCWCRGCIIRLSQISSFFFKEFQNIKIEQSEITQFSLNTDKVVWLIWISYNTLQSYSLQNVKWCFGTSS